MRRRLLTGSVSPWWFRQHAKGAFGEPRRADAEHAVETGAVVLPGNGGGELDQLAFIKLLPQALHHRRRHGDWCLCHRYGQIQHESLVRVERSTGLVARELQQLFFRDTEFSADGRADVESEGAADEGAGLDLGERLQTRVDAVAGQ